MDDEMTVNLTAALRSNATDLSGVANQLAGLSTDQEIEHQAKVLDCVAEDASQGAAILRAMIARARTSPWTGVRRFSQCAPGPPRTGYRRVVTGDAAAIENLELLRREWGHAYVIWFQAGQYCACRRDNAAICRRPKTDGLRKELDTDYQACPVLV